MNNQRLGCGWGWMLHFYQHFKNLASTWYNSTNFLNIAYITSNNTEKQTKHLYVWINSGWKHCLAICMHLQSWVFYSCTSDQHQCHPHQLLWLLHTETIIPFLSEHKYPHRFPWQVGHWFHFPPGHMIWQGNFHTLGTWVGCPCSWPQHANHQLVLYSHNED